jgi:allantoicase
MDLLSQSYGGIVAASSDDYFSGAAALNRPGLARTMGEGWETRRRRDAGHDFVVFRLGFAGQIRRLIVDTSFFRYNASDSVAVYGGTEDQLLVARSSSWQPILPRTRVQPDTRHEFAVQHHEPVAAIRLDAFPDGGLSRVRAIGNIDRAARAIAGYRWFNALPAAQAAAVLADGGIEVGNAAELVGGRPLHPSRPEPAGSDPPRRRGAADHGALVAILEGRHPPGRRGDESATAQP